MNENTKFVSIFMRDLRMQDKLDSHKLDINLYERSLASIIETYQDIYSFNIEGISSDFEFFNWEMKRQKIFSYLERLYKYNINILKKEGADVSEYPKTLEDLTK
jgi:hypothetical protein